MVGTVADHRTEAFAGCRFIMDSLEDPGTFWKREHLDGGNALWVRSKEEWMRVGVAESKYEWCRFQEHWGASQPVCLISIADARSEHWR